MPGAVFNWDKPAKEVCIFTKILVRMMPCGQSAAPSATFVLEQLQCCDNSRAGPPECRGNSLAGPLRCDLLTDTRKGSLVAVNQEVMSSGHSTAWLI